MNSAKGSFEMNAVISAHPTAPRARTTTARGLLSSLADTVRHRTRAMSTRQFVVLNALVYLALVLVRFVYVNVWFQDGIRLAELTHDPRAVGLCLVQGVLLAALVGLFIVGLLRLESLNLSIGGMTRIAFLLGAIAFVAIPVNSNDTFVYVGFGRMMSLYGLNPYLHSYTELSDAYSVYAWFKQPMPYGPLLAPVFAVAGLLSQIHVFAGVYFVKLVFAAAYVACLFLMKPIASAAGTHGARNFYLFALNPLVILEFVADAHTEALLAMFFFLAIVALQKRAVGLALMAAFLSTLVKLPPGAVLLAAIGVYALRQRKYGAIVSAALPVAACLFVLHLTLFPSITAVRSLLMLLDLPNPNSLYSIPIDLVQSVAKRGFGLSVDEATELAAVVGKGLRSVLLLLLSAFAAWRFLKIHNLETCIRECGFVLLALVSLGGYWSCPWYVLWALPLAVASTSGLLRNIAVSFCLTMPLLYIVPSVAFAKYFPIRALRLVAAHLLPYGWLALRDSSESNATKSA